METKFLPMEVKATGDGDDKRYRQVEGYGSVFGNRDSYGDIIVPGAFAESIKAKEPKMAWQHDLRTLVGRWDEVREDDHGLFLKGRIATSTPKGNEAAELVSMGALTGLSIGFNTVRDEMDRETGLRRLMEIDLWEVSFVTVPANSLANVTNIKSIRDIRAFEAALREMGFSRKDAVCIASHGFKAWADQRDAEPPALSADEQRDAADLATSLTTMLKEFAL